MASQSKTRKVWQDAKKKAGDALKGMKFRDDYGPMLEAYEKLNNKIDKAETDLNKLKRMQSALEQKLANTRSDYITKIERSKLADDVKQALVEALSTASEKAKYSPFQRSSSED